MDKQNVVCTHNAILSALKRKDILTHTSVEMTLENITLSEKSQSQEKINTLWFHLDEVLRAVKFRDRK